MSDIASESYAYEQAHKSGRICLNCKNWTFAEKSYDPLVYADCIIDGQFWERCTYNYFCKRFVKK